MWHCLRLPGAFPKAAHIATYPDCFRYKSKSLGAQSLHRILHLHKDNPILKWFPEWRVCWGAAEFHPDKCKTCAPGNWCYLKENRFAGRTLVGFSMWQAQKTRNAAGSPEFTVHAATAERWGEGHAFCTDHESLSDLLLLPPFPIW